MMDQNPWDVLDASLFLKYCCPECDHQCKELHGFAEHALSNHERSKVLFDKDSNIEKQEVKCDVVIKTEPVDSKQSVQEPVNDNEYNDDAIMDDQEEPEDDQEQEEQEDQEDQDDPDFEAYEADDNNDDNFEAWDDDVKDEHDEDYMDEEEERPLRRRGSNKKKKRRRNLGKPDPDGWTSCEYCPKKKFLFVFELLEHMTQVHGGERYVVFPLTYDEIVEKDANLAETEYVCKICNDKEKYQFKSQLVSHWYAHHGKTNHPYDACQWCMELFDSWESILKHHEKVHPELTKREYPCTEAECYGSGSELSRLAKHYRRHDVPYTLPIKCDICDLSFIIEESLLYHQKNHHSQEMETHYCTDCSMSFLSESLKLVHMSMHGTCNEISNRYLCKFCLKNTTTKEELVAHCRDNHEFENLPFFFCDKCDFVSHKITITEEHYKTVHELEKYSPFRCKHCDHIDNSLTTFRRHVNTHRDVGHHVCEDCGKVLRSKSYLKYHIEYHHNKKEKICVCDFCGFKTTHQHWLRRHILHQHTKGKTRICEYCKKAFRDKNSLEVHLDGHHPGTTEQKFFCQECGVGYMYQYSLTCHMRKHKGPRKKPKPKPPGPPKVKDLGPVRCPHCDKTLIGQDNLSRHITQSHKKLTCEKCSKTVLNKFQLKKHMFFDHGCTDGAFLCQLCPEQVFFSKMTHQKHMQKAHHAI